MRFLSLQGKTGSRELCCSLSAAGDRRRNMQPFVPRVTQGQRSPRVQKPVSNFGNGLYIFNFGLLRLITCSFGFGFTAIARLGE